MPVESADRKNITMRSGESHSGTAFMDCRKTPVYAMTNNAAANPTASAMGFARRTAAGSEKNRMIAKYATHRSSAVRENVPMLMYDVVGLVKSRNAISGRPKSASRHIAPRAKTTKETAYPLFNRQSR